MDTWPELLINDAIRGQSPTGCSRKPWIRSGNQVVVNRARSWLEHKVCHGTETLAMAVDEVRIQQCRQTIEKGGIGDGRLTSDEDLIVGETTALIEPPDLTTHPQRGWTTDPTQQPMDWRMHPGHDAWAMVQAEVTTNGVLEKITQQQLLGNSGQERICTGITR